MTESSPATAAIIEAQPEAPATEARRTYDGIIVSDRWVEKGRREGKRWRFRVRDTRTKRYRSKAFAEYDKGMAWARSQRARFQAGLEMAGRLPVSQVLEDFIEDLTRRGLTPKHIHDVRVHVEQAEKAGIRDLRSPDLKVMARRWLSSCVYMRNPTRAVAPKTQINKLRALKAVIHFAMANDWLDRDVLFGVKVAYDPAKVRVREIFSVDELRMMVGEAHREDQAWLPACILAYLGLRIGEVRALDWSWFDWKGRRLTIRQKADWAPKFHRERAITLMDELVAIMEPIAQARGTVFPWMTRFKGSALSHWFSAYFARVGIDRRGRAAHCCRHSWISLRAAIGVSTVTVKHEAGHGSLETTERYLHLVPPGWIEGWPKDGQFWLRREPAKG